MNHAAHHSVGRGKTITTTAPHKSAAPRIRHLPGTGGCVPRRSRNRLPGRPCGRPRSGRNGQARVIRAITSHPTKNPTASHHASACSRPSCQNGIINRPARTNATL
jgi:hypothetical protein